MNANTTASSLADDLKKVNHLASDPVYYDGTCGRVPKIAYVGPYALPLLSADCTGSGTSVESAFPTEAISPERIKQWARQHRLCVVGANETSGGARADYKIKPSLGSERDDTLATMDPELSLPDLINQFRHLPRIAFAERIYARLDYLLHVSREEQPDQAPPAAASLKGFLAFLSKNEGLAYPTIVLTPDGNVRAQWRRGSDEHFAIAFLNDKDVFYVVFAPDPKHPQQTIRVSSSATVESVMSVTADYGVLRWAAEKSAETWAL